MPVATFPGERNWGYDGLYTWAPHPAYGGPGGLAALVDAAHGHGLGVILDVVYNHLGPGTRGLRGVRALLHRAATAHPGATRSTSTTATAAACASGRSRTPACGCATTASTGCAWTRSTRSTTRAPGTCWPSCARASRAAGGGAALTIAESDLNDPKVVRGREAGGWGFDAQWSDDFHHALHALLTGERDGYYAGLRRAWPTWRPPPRARYVYDGRYSSFRRPSPRRAGRRLPAASASSSAPRTTTRSATAPSASARRSPARRLAAMWVLLSPFTPMLFMGEEYGEDAAVPVLHRPHRPVHRRRHARGAPPRVQGVRGLRGRDPRPAGPGDLRRARCIDPAGGDPAVRDLYRGAASRCAGSCRPTSRGVRFDEEGGWIGVRRGARRGGRATSRTTTAEVAVEASGRGAGDRRRGGRCVDGRRRRCPALGGRGGALMRVWPGWPFPLGATWDGGGTNFSLFSENATARRALPVRRARPRRRGCPSPR